MRLNRREACRGLGRFFVRLEIEGIGDARVCCAQGILKVKATAGDRFLPARLRPYSPSGPYALPTSCVLDFPETHRAKVHLEIWLEGQEEDGVSFTLCPLQLIWESRLSYRLRRSVITGLREGENDFAPNAYTMSFLGRFEQNEGASWRLSISWQVKSRDSSTEREPAICVIDEVGKIVCAKTLILERETTPTGNGDTLVEKRTIALFVPDGLERFTVCASDPEKTISDGFCCMDRLYRNSLSNTYRDTVRDACSDDALYQRWLRQNRSSLNDLCIQARDSGRLSTTFSIIVPCYNSNAEYFRQMINSVLRQSYPHWELLLLDASPNLDTVREAFEATSDQRVKYVRLEENAGIVGNTNEGIRRASGDYLAFLDHDDLIEPDALYWYARAIEDSERRPEVLYCDEDSFHGRDDFGQPSFKSDLNPDLLYSHNYITHLLVVERALVEKIGLSDESVSGAQDYDLTLRALAAGATFHHVPRMLYHWRIHESSTNNGNLDSKPYALEAGRVALERHFAQRGISAKVENADEPFVYRVRYALPQPLPLVSVIIPTRDHPELLAPCLKSLLEKSTYPNVEIVLVENGSTEPDTGCLYEKYLNSYPDKVKLVRWNDEFNYSSIINYGVKHSSGDYLLLLNNDTEVISPDFMFEMLGYLQRPEVGVVGAKLYFADDLIQHAGMIVGAFDALVHVNQYLPSKIPGYLARAIRPGNFTAVTGACQMVRRSVFEELGGYDESFVVGFNDADFCLRVRKAGYLVTFTPYAELYHYEFCSRGRDSLNRNKMMRWKREQARFMERWPEYYVDRDPYSNPNLKKNNLYFALNA